MPGGRMVSENRIEVYRTFAVHHDSNKSRTRKYIWIVGLAANRRFRQTMVAGACGCLRMLVMRWMQDDAWLEAVQGSPVEVYGCPGR